MIKGYMVDQTGKDLEEFDKLTEAWKRGHEIIGKLDTTNRKFTREGRVTEFANLISGILVNTNISPSERSTLAELLVCMGILDPSHLAIIPSSYLLDSAAWMMMPDKINIRGESLDKHRLVKLVGSPMASVELSQEYAGRVAENRNRLLKSPDIRTGIMNKEGWENFLRIRIHGRSSQRRHIVTHNIRFAELISGLKYGVAPHYPETGTYSLVDLLISRGSNPFGPAGPFERSESERPKFLLVRDELARMSLSRKMYDDEPISVTATRNLLLGKPSSKLDEREKILRNAYLGHYEGKSGDFFNLVQEKGGQIKFGEKEFKPSEFSNSVKERLSCMGIDYEDKIEGVEFDHENERQSNAILTYLCWLCSKCEPLSREDENGDSNIREILTQLSQDIKLTTDEKLEELLTGGSGEKHLFEKSEMVKELNSLAIFLDQLGNMYFQGERQYQYRFGKSGEGRGVSFDLDGTIDAVRTVSHDYLAILNHSVDLPTTLINRSVQYYFQDFLEQEKAADEQTATGGFFSQHLNSGPLAHLTIVQQGSGPIELSASYDNLMTTLDRKGISEVSGTLIHPYSFIKNMLWLSTFRGQWLSRKSKVEPRYAESFDIKTGAIESIFGSPKRIQQEIYSVRHSNDLSGIRLPSMDNEAWGLLKKIHNGASEDDQEILERKHYLLTDLLMINWIRCTAIAKAIKEKNGEESESEIQKSAERHVSKMLEEPDTLMKDITEIYPKKLWFRRIERRFKPDHLYYPEISLDGETETTMPSLYNDEGLDDGISSIIGELEKETSDSASPHEDYEKQAQEWMECLRAWAKFCDDMANESQNDSQRERGEDPEETS